MVSRMTQREVAAELGVSRQYVEQIELRALAKVAKIMRMAVKMESAYAAR